MSRPDAPVPWAPPRAPDPAHSKLVFDAWLIVCGESESTVKAWRSLLEAAFCVWRDKHGTKPPPTEGLLGLYDRYADKPLQDCPPYKCAGPEVRNYVELLMFLVRTSPRDLHWLARIVPWKKMLATMVLSEATDFDSGGIIQAHLALVDLERQEREWEASIQLNIAKRLLPLAQHGRKMRGNPKRKGKSYGLKKEVRAVCKAACSTQFDEIVSYFELTDNTDRLLDDRLLTFTFDGRVPDGIAYFKPDDNISHDPPRVLTFETLRRYLTEFAQKTGAAASPDE